MQPRVTSSQAVQCYAVSCYFVLLLPLRRPSVKQSRVTSYYFSHSIRPVLCSLVLLLTLRPPSVMQSRVTFPFQAAQRYAASCYFSLAGRLVLCSLVLLLPLRPSCVMESRVTSPSQAGPLTNISRSATPRAIRTSECSPGQQLTCSFTASPISTKGCIQQLASNG